MNRLLRYIHQPTSILPLVIFRIAFGLLLCISQLRFIHKGWVDELYIDPTFHFTFEWFSWVEPIPAVWMHIIVWLTAILALCIAIGLFYRVSCTLFFLLFTYLELIDKAYYLNHYYFVSLIAFLMIWLPAHYRYSIDSKRFKLKYDVVPRWAILVPRIQLAIVYFFAGVAKLKYDWLILGQPMKIWLKARTDLPIIGHLFDFAITPYVFSWAGMVYDLTIAFFLFYHRTRPLAYVAVIVFHVLTYSLFYIGMFPWIMIVSTLVFFEFNDWKRIFPRLSTPDFTSMTAFQFPKYLLIPYFILQLILPLRHYAYHGSVLEHEQGFRFAWHVMVMEKTGHVEYQLTDIESGRSWKVFPSDYLTLAQEKQMSFQKDMIIEFGQYLRSEYNKNHDRQCTISAKNWTSLNGRPSQLREFINFDFNN